MTVENDAEKIKLVNKCLLEEGFGSIDSDNIILGDSSSLPGSPAALNHNSKKYILVPDLFWGGQWLKYLKCFLHHEISHLRHNDSNKIVTLWLFENSNYFKSEHLDLLKKLVKKIRHAQEYRADMESVTSCVDNAENLIECFSFSFIENVKNLISIHSLPADNVLAKIYYQALNAVKSSEVYLKHYDKDAFCKLAKNLKTDFNQYYDITHPNFYKRIEAIKAIMLECEQEGKKIA